MDRPIMQLDWQPLCSLANRKQSQTFDALVNRSAIISLITISRLENELKINFPSKLGRKQWRLFSSQNLIDCQLSSAKVFVTCQSCHTTNGKYMFKFDFRTFYQFFLAVVPMMDPSNNKNSCFPYFFHLVFCF